VRIYKQKTVINYEKNWPKLLLSNISPIAGIYIRSFSHTLHHPMVNLRGQTFMSSFFFWKKCMKKKIINLNTSFMDDSGRDRLSSSLNPVTSCPHLRAKAQIGCETLLFPGLPFGLFYFVKKYIVRFFNFCERFMK